MSIYTGIMVLCMVGGGCQGYQGEQTFSTEKSCMSTLLAKRIEFITQMYEQAPLNALPPFVVKLHCKPEKSA